MPLIAYPWALLGLAALPGLVLIYFLYSRFRRREVSSLFLWRDLGRQAAGHGRMRVLRPPLAFWLEALLLLLLALAAAGLCWRSRQLLRPLVIVLDDSRSMQALSDGLSARDRALAALRRELRRLQPSSVRLVLAGRTPQVGARQPPHELDAALRRWRCRGAAADLDKAIMAARAHAPETRVLVLTDAPPTVPVLDPAVKWLAVGRPAANAGIAQAVRTAVTPDTDRVLVQVAVSGTFPVAPVLALSVDGRDLHRGELPPAGVPAPAGPDLRTVICAVPAAGRLRIELTPDALEADNRCELPPAWRPQLQVDVLTARPALAEALRRALRAVLPAVAAESAAARLLFVDADGLASAAPLADAWLVRFHAPAGGESYTGPFVLNRTHPLTEGLDLAGLVWHGSGVDGSGLPVLLAGDVPLLTDRELPGGAHQIDLVLDPDRSTLLQSPAWPVLIWNLLHWRAQAAPGFAANRAVCGQWVRFIAAPGATGARLTLPDGSTALLRARAGSRETGFVPEEPGLYVAESGARRFEMDVQPGAPDESDLSRCATGLHGGWGARFALDEGYWHAAAGLGGLAAFLLAAHAWLVYGPYSIRRRAPQAS
jgi:hypothetical protein